MAQEIIGLTKNIYETYQKASLQLQRLLLGFFWDRFEVYNGVIIKSVPSILFDELIKAEKAYFKNEDTLNLNVSKGFINSPNWCTRLESNQRPSA